MTVVEVMFAIPNMEENKNAKPCVSVTYKLTDKDIDSGVNEADSYMLGYMASQLVTHISETDNVDKAAFLGGARDGVNDMIEGKRVCEHEREICKYCKYWVHDPSNKERGFCRRHKIRSDADDACPMWEREVRNGKD